MKRVILTIVSTLFLITNLFSQNRVWVTIPNLEIANSELTNIVSIQKAFPSSKTRSLQDVYEIITTTSSEVLVDELKKRNDLFINPVVGPTYKTLETPNDYNTIFSNQWALNLINATSVWDITKGSSDITIAITDANYHLNHEELIGKFDYVSPNSSTDYTHGTAVSTIAAGNTNNTVGTSSIGYNSRLQLRAMNYNELLNATYSGAKVINCSWASSCSFNGYAQQVIDEVYMNGSVVVASAGNGSTCGGASNLVYPASYNHVISVTSVGVMDNHERFMGNPSSTHQHNSMVDICAPGYDVPLTTSSGVYVTGNGTSFASPFVSGTVALMLSVNPCLSVDDIEYLLKESCDTNVYLINPQYVNQLGAGRLDALKAVQMAKNFKTINGLFKETVDCVTGNKSLSVLNLDGISPYEYMWSNETTSSSVIVENDGYIAVEITDSIGCRFVDSVYVEKYFKMSTQEEKTDVSCFGLTNGSVSIEVLNGTNPELPVWDNGFVGRDRSNLSVGDYTYSVIDNFGCEIIDTVSIRQPENLISTISSVNPTQSSFGNINVTVNGGTQPYEYEWNNGSLNEDLNDVLEGFYELLVIDANGCMTSSNIILNTENSLGINEVLNNQFVMYPNPSNGKVTIKNTKDDNCNLVITNTNGQQVVVNQSFVDETNVSDLSEGIYLVTVNNVTQKLVVK